MGRRGIRHPWELPLLFVGIAITVIGYMLWIAITVFMIRNLLLGKDALPPSIAPAEQYLAQTYVMMGAVGLVLWIARALMYADPRATAVRLSPTQFPEGYRMLVEAAEHHRLRRVPDAYVQTGSGTINAFASGHGFRRFVVVYSDLFEVGGAVRDPDALRFVISHEVGHLAAGHVSYFRLLFSYLLVQIPVLGKAFSRAQEFTADNFGYDQCPQGAPGVMGVLAAGKYLNADVNVNELADRAATEKGLWVHIVNWMSTHPVATWRTHALRDRSRPGHLWFRPGFLGRSPGAMYQNPMPAGSTFTREYPTPSEVLAMLDRADALRPAGMTNQFGRFPGVDYSARPSMRQVQTAAPLLAPRIGGPMGGGPTSGGPTSGGPAGGGPMGGGPAGGYPAGSPAGGDATGSSAAGYPAGGSSAYGGHGSANPGAHGSAYPGGYGPVGHGSPGQAPYGSSNPGGYLGQGPDDPYSQPGQGPSGR